MTEFGRSEFQLPAGLVYLNCAYMSPLPRRTEEAGVTGMRRKRVPSRIFAPDFFHDANAIRAAFGRLVEADPTRVAITPSASYGISTAARNCAVSPGQNIVLSGEQFPSNAYPWLRLAKANDLEVRVVDPPAEREERGRLWNERLWEAIDSATAVVALPAFHWTDGTRFDLVRLGGRAREVGAALVIDGTQSVGAVPFSVEEIRPDALIVAGYKWLLGPYSTGVAYFGDRFDGGEPLEETWLSRPQSDDFRSIADLKEEYRPGAVRFDVGQVADFILLPMLLASLELLLEWSVSAIEQHCSALASDFLLAARGLGLEAESDAWRGDHLFGLRLPAEVSIEELQTELAQRQIHVSLRGDAVRVSPHVYNETADMEALFEALRDFLPAG
ncbi:MAG: aminotransferase class V-fold PLP-dependent enzyme [Gemmatimonadota bacterium]